MKIEVSAPGKLVLIGEYGVLFGAPAVVMAVDRRALVELRSADGTRWILTAPEVAPRSVEFEVSPDGGNTNREVFRNFIDRSSVVLLNKTEQFILAFHCR